MRILIDNLVRFALICVLASAINGQTTRKEAISKTRKYITEIVNNSYPLLSLGKIRVKTFDSDSNYFKARFSIARFMTFQRMRHLVFVNPKVFDKKISEVAIKSILAHELAHILYYKKKNRIQLLGLTGLVSPAFNAKFERKADIEAIARGYGRGLIEYRKWLYKHIPAKSIKAKRRNYYSPEEVRVMQNILNDNPLMIDVWRKKVPMNLEEIKKSA